MARLEDIVVYQSVLESIAPEGKDKGSLAAEVAEFFLDAAYQEGILDQGKEELPIVTFHAFDCYTLAEQCVAFALIFSDYQRSWTDYLRLITTLRYRDGIITYASRLHYFSDWLRYHTVHGRLKDLTASLGGIPYEKTISYMTSHVALYPRLRDRELWEQIRQTELALTRHKGYYLPPERIEAATPTIKSGDLIALTTETDGLDVMHVTIAGRDQDDNIYLIHASREAGRVIKSSVPLMEYVNRLEHASGIIVARIV